jgi:sugar lactone lactonase YvrE
MKKILLPFLLVAAIDANAQTHSLEKIWETDTTVAVPESVLPDAKKNILYVSLIDGGSWVADGKGGVGKMSPDGKTFDGQWITGLQAPKGLGIVGNRLFVADITEVIVVDIANGKIEKRIQPENAKALNDVTVTDDGIVYVSDSKEGRIWRIQNDAATLYLDSVKGVNGLKAIRNDLYIGGGKSFFRADKNKSLTKIAELPQGIDGIEPVGNGDFIVTSWGGYIYYVSANGTVETLLETHQQKKNTADVGYDMKNKILYVPTFNGKTVAAYKLK